MKAKPAPLKSSRRRRRNDPSYRARQLTLLKREVSADYRALMETLNLVIAELRSWK